jgi:HAMP domain-containing protein
MLRPDPAQRHRLEEIIANLHDRLAEARQRGWLGEVDGLQASLAAAEVKLEAMTRAARRTATPIDLGMPARPHNAPVALPAADAVSEADASLTTATQPGR